MKLAPFDPLKNPKEFIKRLGTKPSYQMLRARLKQCETAKECTDIIKSYGYTWATLKDEFGAADARLLVEIHERRLYKSRPPVTRKVVVEKEFERRKELYRLWTSRHWNSRHQFCRANNIGIGTLQRAILEHERGVTL